MATMAKVFSLVAFYNLLTLVNLVKVVSLYGIRAKNRDGDDMTIAGMARGVFTSLTKSTLALMVARMTMKTI